MEEMGFEMLGKKSMSGFFEAWFEISIDNNTTVCHIQYVPQKSDILTFSVINFILSKWNVLRLYFITMLL